MTASGGWTPHAAHESWDGHLVLLHTSETERRAALAAWVRHGLDGGEKVLYTEAPVASPADSVQAVLSAHGIDVTDATRTGRLAVLSVAEFYPPGGHRELVERALAEGFPAVRLSAEVGAALTVLPEDRHSEIEATMDRLCRTHPVSALCQYQRSATAGPRLRRVIGAHAGGIRNRSLATGADPGGLAVAGELDLATDDLLTSALLAATAAADPSGATFVVDLAAVRFLGAAGCRAIARGTEAYRAAGGTVALNRPQPVVERVIRAFGLADLGSVELWGSR